MAKTLKTRIKNRYDSLTNWSKDGVEILQGEIALVKVETQQIDQATGDVVTVPAFLMKVGENGSDGKPKAFSTLPWLSALAADVYDWAKMQDPSGITVKYLKGTETRSSTLADVLKDLETAESAIEGLKGDVSGVRGLLSVDPASATADGVVQGITYNSSTGKFTVAYGTVQTADIADSAVTTAKIKDANVTTAKIADANVTTAKIADDNVTTGKIADGAVTNAKLGSDISTDKINVGTGTTSGTLSAKIQSIDAAIAEKMDIHTHPYLPDTTTYAGSSSKGGAATSANKVNSSLTVKLNGGSTEGTNLFTFNGSAAKSINITPSAIGAAASSHNHDDRYYTETEIDAKVLELNNSIDGKAASGHNHDDKYITPSAVDTKISTALVSVLKYKGTKANTGALPTSGNATGDVWNITSACAASGTLPKVNAGDNVAWNGSSWDVLAGTVDLSSYYTETEVNALLAEKSDTDHTHNYAGSATAGGAATSANKVNKAVTFTTTGGAAAGTTFDGSTARTISYATVGAAPATHSHTKEQITDFAHTHDDRYYTEDEVDALLAEKAAGTHSHTISAAAEDDDVVVLTGTSGTNGVSYKATHAASGVAVGTYRSVTVNDKGHVTGGTNPTTLSGYGITDAYTKSEVDAEVAKKAASSHAHGNITNSGTITTTALTSTSGVGGVVVTDSNNKVTRMSPATVRSLIGAGTSSLTIGTTASEAAAGNHSHTAHEARTTAIESNYVRFANDKLYVGKDGTDEIIFDCGGAN
jgi:hypothetical protein